MVCAPLIDNIEIKIKDTANLLGIIVDNLNTNRLPENRLLVSFDMVNMFPNIDNVKGIHTRSKNHGSDNKQVKEPPTECIIKGLETRLFNFSSKFDQDYPLNTNNTATRAPNFYSYSDLAIYGVDKLIKNEQISNF